MNDLELRLQPVAGWPAVCAIAVVLIGLLCVRPRHVRLAARQWAALLGLRLLVVLLTLAAMLRPTLVYTKVEPQRASLVLLVDSSRSMQVADSLGDQPRWNAMKLLLEAANEELAKLSNVWDVKAYQFDVDSRRVELRDGRATLGAAPTGEESAIGAAIGEVLDRESSGRVLGVLLMSDGAQRAVPGHDLPPQLALRRLAAERIPLYTFTFGKPGGSERSDLSIGNLVTNETVFTETPTEVRGELRAEGYANQQVKVQLLWEEAGEMEVADTLQLGTGADGESVPVVLRHTPRAPGEYKVTIRVEPRDGELVTTNNEASTFVTVRAGGINVLYLVGAKRVGGGPSQEQRFVRAALAQSPDIVVERRLLSYNPPELDLVDAVAGARSGEPRSTATTAANTQATQDAPEARTIYDVVLIDDVDHSALSQASWRAIADRVRRGMGLAMLGGHHSFGPGGFRDTPIGEILPIDIGPAQRQSFGEPLRTDVHLAGPLRMRPAVPVGQRHPIMQIGSPSGAANRAASAPPAGNVDVATVWAALPPLDGANRFERRELKPNSQLLAEADDPQQHPLLIAGQAGDGRTLAFAGDSTWRWPMFGFADAHRRFWRQCVLWLAKKDEKTSGQVWIRLAGRRVMRGERVEFTLGADDAQGRSINTAQFQAVVTTPDGRTVEVRPVRSGDTWGALFRDATAPGDYKIIVTANDGGVVIGTAEARFLVPNQDLELDRPAAEPNLMAQLAEMTKLAGGAALAPEELPDLLKRLSDKPPEVKVEVIAKVTYWDTWPFLLAFVGLLGSEWYLRKRWGLV